MWLMQFGHTGRCVEPSAQSWHRPFPLQPLPILPVITTLVTTNLSPISVTLLYLGVADSTVCDLWGLALFTWQYSLNAHPGVGCFSWLCSIPRHRWTRVCSMIGLLKDGWVVLGFEYYKPSCYKRDIEVFCADLFSFLWDIPKNPQEFIFWPIRQVYIYILYFKRWVSVYW